MGVPQFFHWLVTHYNDQLLFDDYPHKDRNPEYLYLDFNCAIHPAVKAEGINSLEEMYSAVCLYLDRIIKEVKPTKMVYIAVDGVAPLAKMKQQRVRRFKAVQDKAMMGRIQRKHKCYQPSPFDFNMISPGTQFMNELTEELKQYISEKKYGNKIQFILDDASSPREGEHKIMHHIRTVLKNKKDPRIIVYGLDSDLIFLCLHHYRPRFCLFREKIFFDGKSAEEDDDKSSKFTYLDIGNFRKIMLSMMTPSLNKNELRTWGILKTPKERLLDDTSPILIDELSPDLNHNIRNRSIKNGISKADENRKIDMARFNADLGLSENSQRRLILDYIAMCFILGNDFLPHIPSLKIKDGGLTRTIECYKAVQEQMGADHYLVDASMLNFDPIFFIKLMEYIASYEDIDLMRQTEASEVRRSKFRNGYRLRTADPYQRDVMNWEYIEDKYHDTIRMGTDGWKNRYYHYFLGGQYQKHGLVDRMIDNYLKGLSWTLRYYVGNGAGKDEIASTCPDWEWSYYFRVAPAVSCIFDFLKDRPDYWHKLNFDRKENKPATCHEQLLMIFPPQSSDLLSPEFAKLMKSVDSPLIFQYPTNFDLDLMGHRYRWECYPILPQPNLSLVRSVCNTILDDDPHLEEIKLGSNEEPDNASNNSME